MRIHCFQHVPFEDPATIADWAQARGHALAFTHIHQGQAVPSRHDYDLLLVLGGPMSVWETMEFPWLLDEQAHIRAAVAKGRLVLGICLGAQLLATALGGQVQPNAYPEIGWFPVRLAPDARRTPAFREFPDQFTAFHWHGDAVTRLPQGAHWLAESEACAHQAFALGETALGLQFHLETSAASLEALLRHCGGGLPCAAQVQTPTQMRQGLEHLPALRQHLFALLDHFTA